MSSSLLEPAEATVEEPRPKRRPPRRAHGRINKAWIWGHRWASLLLGLVLLVELTTGAILLYANTITAWVEPDRYVATPSATPIGPLEALRTVQAEHPEIAATYASVGPQGVVTVSGEGGTAAFVDSGTGRVIDVGEDRPWILRLLVNIHDCALTCEGYPGYQAWLATPLPAVNEHVTVGGFVLGSLGVLLLFLVISGAITWWPGLKAWVAGFVVRRGRGAYVRDLDLHRVVGIVSVPFLFMWAFTGAAFEFHWPQQVYAALTPGGASPERELVHGTGPMITVEQAIERASAEHPGTQLTSIYLGTPEEPEGSYGIGLDGGGYSPYRYSGGATQTVWVDVDSHGGGVVEYDYGFGGDTPVAQQLWDNGTYFGLHFGYIVPGWPRLAFLAFGLTPVLLGITGITIWLTKRRSDRNRKARRRKAAAAA